MADLRFIIDQIEKQGVIDWFEAKFKIDLGTVYVDKRLAEVTPMKSFAELLAAFTRECLDHLKNPKVHRAWVMSIFPTHLTDSRVDAYTGLTESDECETIFVLAQKDVPETDWGAVSTSDSDFMILDGREFEFEDDPPSPNSVN